MGELDAINHFYKSNQFFFEDNSFSKTNTKRMLSSYLGHAWRAEDTVDLVRSNKGGWHSPTDIFGRTDPGIKRVCQLMIDTFSRCTVQIAPEFTTEKYDMKGEGWVNVNPQHGYNVPHDHPGYTWSGVYYVLLPEKNDSKSRSGSIELLDPRTNTAAMATDIARSSLYFSPKRTITPKNGMVLSVSFIPDAIGSTRTTKRKIVSRWRSTLNFPRSKMPISLRSRKYVHPQADHKEEQGACKEKRKRGEFRRFIMNGGISY